MNTVRDTKDIFLRIDNARGMNDKCLSPGTAGLFSAEKFRTNFIPIRCTRSRYVSHGGAAARPRKRR